MIFDGVVSTALQVFGDDGPLVLLNPVMNIQNELLLDAPLVLFDERVQVIVPALTTLFTNAPGQVLRNIGPLKGSKVLHQSQDQFVFFFAPRPLDKIRVEYFLPAVEALDICATV